MMIAIDDEKCVIRESAREEREEGRMDRGRGEEGDEDEDEEEDEYEDENEAVTMISNVYKVMCR